MFVVVSTDNTDPGSCDETAAALVPVPVEDGSPPMLDGATTTDMIEDRHWMTAAWTPCVVNRRERDDRGDVSRVRSHRFPVDRGVTVSPGLGVAPLPVETLTSLLLILFVFAVLLVVLADRPGDGGGSGPGDTFRVFPGVDGRNDLDAGNRRD